MKAKELESLIFNPFYTSMILEYFISGAQSVNKKGIKIELIGIALPFIYNEQISENLSRLNRKSRLNSFVKNEENEIFISLLNEKIGMFRKESQYALVFLSNKTEINISSFISLKIPKHYNTQEDLDLRKICKAAFNLGMIINKEMYLNAFLKLRITAI